MSAAVQVTEAELEGIRQATASGDKHHAQWTLHVLDEDGEVVASVFKTLYVRRSAARESRSGGSCERTSVL